MDQELLKQMRTNYAMGELDEKDVKNNPFEQFEIWFEQAVKAEVNEPNAFVLSTISSQMTPSSRVVLLKGFDERGLIFYTNYLSRKGSEMNANPNVSVVFNWLDLARQVRVEGVVEKVSQEESTQYFNSRPFESRVSAAVSPQSQVIESKIILMENTKQLMLLDRSQIKKPESWGGYIIKPNYFEFWQGRPNRLHDRIIYDLMDQNWIIKRLAP